MVSKYNYVFLIPSYNRYEKLKHLINQIKDIHDYLIIIYNDGSTDGRYNELSDDYTNIKVINEIKNNGKDNFNLTIKSILFEGINVDGDYFVLLADDLILCDDFTKILDNIVQENYIINILSLSDKQWKINGWIDGAFATSKNALKVIFDLIPKSLKSSEGKSTGVWSSVTKSFHKIKNDYQIKNLNYSLTQHNGNDDSKLHPKFRLKNQIIVNNFYNDFKGEEIKITTPDEIKEKKNSEDTSNGYKAKKIQIIDNEDKVKKIQIINNKHKVKKIQIIDNEDEVKNIQIINNEDKVKKIQIINNDTKTKTKESNTPEKDKEVKNNINKMPDDLFIAKLRKKKLKFKKR